MARRAIIVSRIPTTSLPAISPRKAFFAVLSLGLGVALLYAGIPLVKVVAGQIGAGSATSRTAGDTAGSAAANTATAVRRIASPAAISAERGA